MRYLYTLILFVVIVSVGLLIWSQAKLTKDLEKLTSVVELNFATSSDNDQLPQVATKAAESSHKQDFRFDDCVDCESEILKLIKSNLSVTPDSINTSYVPLGGSLTTKNTDWTDVSGASAYINLISDYGEGAKVTWEASLKMSPGGGKAFARLYDATNNIAVDYSEIATDSNSVVTVSSGNLPLWRGTNLYKVQIKSLNSVEVAYSNGKIKISY